MCNIEFTPDKWGAAYQQSELRLQLAQLASAASCPDWEFKAQTKCWLC